MSTTYFAKRRMCFLDHRKASDGAPRDFVPYTILVLDLIPI